MTPKQLEVFVQVVHFGSVTAAAQALDMSQPSVSKSLALIEQQMGFALFERSGGRMRPTAEALQIFEEACRMQQSMARFERFIEQVRRYSVGQLRVCATPALALNVLPLATRRFRQDYPDHGLVVDMFLNNEIEDTVAHRQYDLGFALKPGRAGQVDQAVAHGRIVCVMPATHALAARTAVHWQDLDLRELIYITTDPHIVAALTSAVEGFRERPVSALETNRYSIAVNLVRQGGGVTLVDEFALSGTSLAGLAVRPFEPHVPVAVCAFESGREVVQAPMQLFVEAVRAVLSQPLLRNG